MNSEEYLSRIDKPIPVGKFLVIPGEQEPMERLWYRGTECIKCAQTCIYIQTYDGILYYVKLDVDEESNAYSVNFYANEVLVDEIPDKVANDSLKMLFPTISPLTIGVVVGAVILFGLMVSKKLKF